MGGIGAVLDEEIELARRTSASAKSVILVEGESDRRALEVLAARLDRDLEAERVPIVAIAGATNIGRFLDILPPPLGLSGLYDEAERHVLARALETRNGSGDDLEARGFFMCHSDLEDELIRAVGVPGVLEVIQESGDIESWQRFSNQPAQRGRPVDARLRRFLGTKSGRKIEYAGLLAARIDISRPAESPLLRVLACTH